MFINCPHCRALVATDPVTDQPPERCPRCSVALREPVTWSSLDVADAVTQEDRASPVARADAREGDIGPVLAEPQPAAAETPDAPVPAPTPSELAAYVAAMNTQPPPSPVGSLATWLKPPLVTEVTYTRQQEDGVSDTLSAQEGRMRDVPGFAGPDDAGSTVESGAPAHGDAVDGDDPVSPASNARRFEEGKAMHDDARAAASSADPRTARRDDERADDAAPVPAAEASPPRTTPVARSAPSFAGGSGSRSAIATPVGWKIPAAIGTLVVLLLLQLTLADRAHLATDARWRPAVLALCGALRCSVPAWREPEAFLLLDRNVQPDAGTPGVLRVTATFRNDARWAQPWPRLRLTLSDIDGNAVAVREFAPRDYLGATPAQRELATGQSASIAMDVVEPGARSVAFDFQLH